jgi:hypothetical protein
MITSPKQPPTDGLISVHAFDECLAPVLQDRVEQSSGVFKLTGQEASYARYVDGALLPREPWRRLTAIEANSYISNETKFDPLRHVGLATIDKRFLEPIVPTLRISQHDNRAISSLPGDASEFAALVMHMCTKFAATDEPFVHGVAMKPPGLKTVTFRNNGLFAGLHIDSWDAVDLAGRKRARVRVNVNLGPDPRYLLFVPLSLDSVCNNLPDTVADGKTLLQIQTPLFAAFPTQPVFRLRILPGEAYIAATDYLIHDGSTATMRNHVFTFDIRAHFSF